MIGEKASDLIKEDWPQNKDDENVVQLNGSLPIDVKKFSIKKKKKLLEDVEKRDATSTTAQSDSLS
jgi:hypothetical protein